MNKRTLLAAGAIATSLLIGACGGDEPMATPVADLPSSPAPEETPDSPDGTAGGSDRSTEAPYTEKYNFTATTFDGERFELAVHKGTPVVINFWESW